MKKYEILYHTADIRIKVYGKNLENLFASCASALFDFLVKCPPKKNIKKEIYLEAENYEDLLVFWLNELISSFYAYHFLPGQYKIKLSDSGNKKILNAVVAGTDFNPYDNKIDKEIKAATYHGLKIEQTDNGYAAEIIFDV
jgi:SHS2 domain-containing protein